MTNDSPVYILPLVNYNAPLPFKYSICGVSLNADFIPLIYYTDKLYLNLVIFKFLKFK